MGFKVELISPCIVSNV